MIETQAENIPRRDCFGIIMQIYKESSGNYCITQIKACQHGIKGGSDLKEQLQYCCRKIRITVASKKYIKSFK